MILGVVWFVLVFLGLLFCGWLAGYIAKRVDPGSWR